MSFVFDFLIADFNTVGIVEAKAEGGISERSGRVAHVPELLYIEFAISWGGGDFFEFVEAEAEGGRSESLGRVTHVPEVLNVGFSIAWEGGNVDVAWGV